MVSYGAVESARDTFSKYKVGSNISNDFSYPSFTLKQTKQNSLNIKQQELREAPYLKLWQMLSKS